MRTRQVLISAFAVSWLFAPWASGQAAETTAEATASTDSARIEAPRSIRFHGQIGGAKAVTPYQKDELGFGVAGTLAVELPLSPHFGVQLGATGAFLADGDPPNNPALADEGSATALGAGAGIRIRPLGHRYYGSPTSGAGLWLAATANVLGTGDLTRAAVDAYVGYDWFFSRRAVGIGPMAGLLHVFQPNGALRGSDANIVVFGLHVEGGRPAEKERDGDRDRDGIIDRLDQCPDDPEDEDGFEDEDGCPDKDNDEDGILDSADRCPNDPEDVDGFEDEDGCPDEDNDKDGILDPKDKCPDDPEDEDGFEDEDGCPEKDNDQDGILDVDDLCPNEPETQNGYADHDGCPDSEQIRVLGDKIVLDDRVHFRTNSATIRVVSHPLLERLAKLIADNPNYVHIEVQGHTDARGPDWFNRKLSQERAESVMQFLVSRGIVQKRLSAKGFGPDKPLVDKRSSHAYFMNRRVEFQITREVEQVTRKGGTTPAPGTGGTKTPPDAPTPAPDATDPPASPPDGAPGKPTEEKEPTP